MINIKKYFLLSFCDPKLQKGQQFLGAIIIIANSFIDAFHFTHMLGINPGGEVIGYEIDKQNELLINRLLQKDELIKERIIDQPT